MGGNRSLSFDLHPPTHPPTGTIPPFTDPPPPAPPSQSPIDIEPGEVVTYPDSDSDPGLLRWLRRPDAVGMQAGGGQRQIYNTIPHTTTQHNTISI